MGRLAIMLDASGYPTVDEVGVHVSWTGEKLLRNGWLTSKQGFWRPADSEWVLTYPSQFRSEWQTGTGVGSKVFPRTSWTPAANVAIREWFPEDVPGHAYPNSKGIEFVVPDSPGQAPIAVNFTTLAAAAGLTLPAGTQAVAATGSVPG